MKRLKSHFVHICLLTLSLYLYGCSNNSVSPPVVSTDHTPMWPMFGYNGRHTGNHYSINAVMNPVSIGSIYWVDTLGPTGQYFNDASEISIDAWGNAYMLLSNLSTGKGNIVKIKSDGTVLWRRDTIYCDYNYGSAFSSDETRIFYKDQNALVCIDSSGKRIWADSGLSLSNSPVVDKSGIIYSVIDWIFTAVNPDGSIKWQIPGIHLGACHPSLDRDGNIYILSVDYNNYSYAILLKINTSGNIVWRKTFLSNYMYYSISPCIVIDGLNDLYFKTDSLYSLDKNGNRRWSHPISGYLPTPAITGDDKLLLDNGNSIVEMDSLGNTIWTCSVPNATRGFDHSIVLDNYNNVYGLLSQISSSAYAYSIDKSGNLRWVIQVVGFWYGFPGLILSPNGNLLGTPKRPGIIYSLN